jgi:hypothetical protein
MWVRATEGLLQPQSGTFTLTMVTMFDLLRFETTNILKQHAKK